ncbi:hypothetical protein [Natronolimnohabitans innermongolicus]|uniref:Uncharacterized protein n=1 Tax=Natronolimnohabitans innermongolicus JCM 12255 TaxID=1227499 RepID=L9XBJ1_9EURY|nr:hypothetical protein [Natronolimnohabitans innermongolicus]ELY58987.1 hypothetical protein C493_06060 [Natronolimnohabitans innermongolicus JCM 12255]
MTTRSVALLGVLALVVVGLLGAPVASGAVGVFADTDAGDDEPSHADANASVTGFMQSSATDAENTVESGMFDATYNGSDDERRAELVRERTDDLEERLERLEAERETLTESSDEDDLHPGKYQSQLAQLTVEIRSLEREIDRTEQRAAETGVDTERLDNLRANASDLEGPEVAAMARGLAGVDEIPGNGPPTDRGGGPGQNDQSGNHTAGQGDGGPPAEAPGAPSDAESNN